MFSLFYPNLAKVKLVLSLFISFALHKSIHAQTFYIEPQIGFAGSAVNRVEDTEILLFEDVEVVDIPNYETNYYGTLGKGFAAKIKFGYRFSNNFAIESGFKYFISTVQKIRSLKTPSYFVNQHWQNVHFQITPSLTINANGDVFKPYASFGLAIPIGGKTVLNASFDEPYGGVADIGEAIGSRGAVKAITEGKFAIGFASRVGLEIVLTKSISIVPEFEFQALSIKSKRTYFKEFDVVNYLGNFELVDRSLEDLTVFEKEINYVDALTASSNIEAYNDDGSPIHDPNKPEDQLALIGVSNSFGINIGVRISF